MHGAGAAVAGAEVWGARSWLTGDFCGIVISLPEGPLLSSYTPLLLQSGILRGDE